MKSVRRTLSGVCALALAATMGAAIAAPAQSATRSKATHPPLALQAASERLTLQEYGQRVYLNLGVYVVAGDGPFAVYAHRSPDYVGPIAAQMSLAGGSFTDLPDGLLKSFRGLSGFLHIVIRDADGKTVYHKTRSFCPSYGAQRIRPDAPDTSPYPQGCPYNPFTLGGVYGIEEGFGVPAVEQYGRAVRLDHGLYTATVSIAPPWRGLIGASATDARVSVQLRVVKGQDCYYGRSAEPAARGCKLPPRSSDALGRIPTHPAARRPAVANTKADPDPSTLPDLQTLPAFGIELSSHGFLNFAATEWDAGPAPMVIDGFRNPVAPRIMGSYQYFFNPDGTSAGHKRIGRMEWDPRPGHQHWHFEDFARYSLLDASQTEVVRSHKQGFCLANTDAVDYTVPGAVWNPYNTDLSTACGDLSSLAVREVLLAGSGDTYYQSRPGQSFNVQDLPNGIYYVKIEVNPNGNMWETDKTNNASLRKIRLVGSGANRTVEVFPVGDIAAN